jgi:hypothetical protein
MADIPDTQIDTLLSKAARQALRDIKARKYSDKYKSKAKEIIFLGLAIHGGSGRVKALFGQGWKAT